jgi:hypothetical protein
MDDRKEFLTKMYDQMFNDIDTHILVVWQSATALVAGVAILALAEKNVLPIDVGVALIELLVAWLLAHLLDASFWYNRNLVIIANIERQFLDSADQRKIHYYFGAHRPQNRMISHLKIQFALGVGVGSLIIVYHFLTRVLPGITAASSSFDPLRSLPYIGLLASLIFLIWLHRRCVKAYAEFVKNSPGITVDTSGIAFGDGHGYKKGEPVVGGGA